MKKTVSILLALIMIISVCPIFSFAEEGTEKANNYPFILVHGLVGWGQYDTAAETEPYWGSGAGMSEGTGNFTRFLTENGYEAYAVSVGPFNSAWDRACEMYAQLTGTVVDYGEAHSKAHNHDRFGRSFVGIPLMGRVWSPDEPLNLIGHSFGGPASRLFNSLMTYGDETELAATGDDTSPLFKGGHTKAVHSIITLSGCHNGAQVADLAVDTVVPIFLLAAVTHVLSVFGKKLLGHNSDMGLAHFGITPLEGETKVKFSLGKLINFIKTKDHAGYDLTVGGSQNLNEQIRMNPETYYYSISGSITQENKYGRQEQAHEAATIFTIPTWLIANTQGLKFDGIKMDSEWATSDGLVPLKSALYPIDETDNSFSYEEALSKDEIKPGSWYYTEPIFGMDHGDYCGTTDDYPEGYEKFWLGLAEMATAR